MTKSSKFVLVILLFMTSLVSAVFLCAVALNLKLISDDYCTAQEASARGIVEFTILQYQNWTGAFVAAVANSLFGSWMATTIFSYPYLLWVLVSATIASVSIYLLLSNIFNLEGARSRFFLLSASLIAYTGFVLGQFGLPSEMDDVDFALGYMWLGWVAAGLSQIFPTLLLVLAVGFVMRYERCGNRINLIVAAALALLLGQFNFLSALTFIILMTYRALSTLVSKRIVARADLMLLVLTVFGALLNYFSPGTRARAKLVSENQDLLTFDNVSGTSKALLQGVFSDSSIYAVLLGITLGLILSMAVELYVRQILAFTTLLFASTLIATFIIENLAFSEPWHYVQASFSTYLLTLIFGTICGFGLKIVFRRSDTGNWISVITAATLLVLISVQAWLVFTHVNVRSTSWSANQDAGVFFIADRGVDWISECWNDLVEDR